VLALIDRGSQLIELNVIDASLIKPLGLTPVDNILIRGIVGHPVQAELVKIQIKLSASENESCVNDEFITIICAACDNLNESLIVTLPVADQLYSILQYEFSNNANTVNLLNVNLIHLMKLME